MDTAQSIAERRSELDRRIRSALERLLADGDERARLLKAACADVLRACADGLPLRHLRSCANVGDAECVRLAARELPLRSGPYPLHLRGFQQAAIDDFAMEGEALLVGAKGAVSTRDGKLLVVEAQGRFSASDQFHIVRPAPGDLPYLRCVLGALDAGRYAKGTNAARVIELADLRSAIVPWPQSEKRRQFAETMGLCERMGAEEFRRLLARAWMLAAHDVARLERADALPPRTPQPRPREDRSDGTPAVDEGVLAVADGLLAALARTGEEPIDVVASTGSSTGGLADPGSVHRSAVCVCFPPPNQGTWTNRAVDAADPRWVFGPPPRNKANFAWIQQTVACMEEDGCALMLLCNAALHTQSGREAAARRAWARSGLVEAVIALPGGLFADGRPPASLVIMRKGRRRADTLFVNALELGEARGIDPSGNVARRLPREAAQRIVGAFEAWAGGSGPCNEPGFCRAAASGEVKANGCVLTPWTHV